MADKSPRQKLSQKSGKSLKEKRATKKGKDQDQVIPPTPTKSRRG